jgi:PIN domain nuclease of toxin-antitoxin system
MIVAIADTHAVIWYLFYDPRLGKAALAFINETVTNGDHIGVSAISLAEMVYLVEKARIPANSLIDLHSALSDPASILQHVPLDEAVAMRMTGISRSDIPDLPDRIIAATALYLGVPVISRDGRIRTSNVRTLW